MVFESSGCATLVVPTETKVSVPNTLEIEYDIYI